MTLARNMLGAAAALGLGATAAHAQDEVQVGIVAVNYNSPSINIMATTAEAAAEARGWEVEVFDGQGDQVATNNAANNYIDRGFDAIINIASPNPQMTGVIERANEAGIPFVSTFSGLAPGITADIGSNNTADGVIATTEMVGRLEGQGKVVKLNWNVLPALRERDHGFHAMLEDYPDVEVIEIEVKVPGQVDDAYNQLTNILLSNPDVSAVWTGWDELVAPAARAIEQAGLEDEVFIVSMDGNPEAIDLIRGDAPVALTVAYDIDRMGEVAVGVVEAALNGNPPASKLLTLKPCLITDATVPPEGEPVNFSDCLLFSGEALAQ
ncbi:MAG: sugar ABC transporter substrate-binding protein [Rhodosalinus sp.]